MGLLPSPPITLIKASSQGLVPSQIPHFLTLEFRIAKHRSGSNIILKSITPELPWASFLLTSLDWSSMSTLIKASSNKIWELAGPDPCLLPASG